VRKRSNIRLTSFLTTGFSIKDRWTNFGNLLRGSKSASSATLLLLRTSVLRLGIDWNRFGCMFVILFLASSRVDSLGLRGKFVIEVMSLSVKSMASCGPATPRFSIVGILWPTCLEKEYINWARSSIVSVLFTRTSEVKLALFEWVEVGEGGIDQFCREPHGGLGLVWFTSACSSLGKGVAR
jgi:hypothetical protein